MIVGKKRPGGTRVLVDGVERGIIKRSRFGAYALTENGKVVTPWLPTIVDVFALAAKRYEQPGS